MEHYWCGDDLYAEISADDLADLRLDREASNAGLPMNVVLGQAIWAALGREGRPWVMKFEDTPDGLAVRFKDAFGEDG